MLDRCTYGVLELRTGAMDGWYRTKAMALGSLALFRRDFPGGRYILIQQLPDTKGQLDQFIPDWRWWVAMLPDAFAAARQGRGE